MPPLSPPTIFALASAAGRAGVAVVRVSGTAAREAIARLCRPEGLPAPRAATLRAIVDPRTGERIDHALILWFPAPHSFTGEDVAEFHLHGGRAVVQGVIDGLQGVAGCRLAEPGEFTRRAFENGKLDLTEAEAVADLIAAETESQRRQALRQLEGALGALYRDWSDRLKRILAHSEAAIDFADEDLPPDLEARQAAETRDLIDAISRHLDDAHRGERLREGFTVAILGPPNAGKSSLLNALARREVAIVSPTPGTTRDIIEVRLDLGGYPVTLADTAGLRESADAIESEGVRRALARAEQADLKILVFDGTVWPARDAATQALVDGDSLVVVNKCDLAVGGAWGVCAEPLSQASPPLPQPLPQGEGSLRGKPEPNSSPLAGEVRWGGAPPAPLPISATTGVNLALLTQRLTEAIASRFAVNATPALTRARHRAALEEARDHLARAIAAPEAALRAEDLRLALRALGRITGTVDVEDLLDVIFREFCIGK